MTQQPPRPTPRRAAMTDEFARWSRSLDSERQSKVCAAITRIVERGPTLGRPHVDVIHGSRLHKLKEARIDRGTRVLFAFDSNQNAVMLLGGDLSDTERREDLYVAGLARYVAALGGRVEVRAVFDDEEILVHQDPAP